VLTLKLSEWVLPMPRLLHKHWQSCNPCSMRKKFGQRQFCCGTRLAAIDHNPGRDDWLTVGPDEVSSHAGLLSIVSLPHDRIHHLLDALAEASTIYAGLFTSWMGRSEAPLQFSPADQRIEVLCCRPWQRPK
jgi:hypothetical protein